MAGSKQDAPGVFRIWARNEHGRRWLAGVRRAASAADALEGVERLAGREYSAERVG